MVRSKTEYLIFFIAALTYKANLIFISSPNSNAHGCTPLNKHSFLNFQMDQSIIHGKALHNLLANLLYFHLIHQWNNPSIFLGTTHIHPHQIITSDHTCHENGQWSKTCIADSFSTLQKTHSTGASLFSTPICFKKTPVFTLFLQANHPKNWTLGGMSLFHTNLQSWRERPKRESLYR